MLSIHIHSQTSQGGQLLQLTLWSRRTTKILQLSDNPQHSRQCDLTHAEAEALVRTKAKVGVLTQVAVQTDLFRVGPCLGVVACGDLERGIMLGVKSFSGIRVKWTYQVDEYVLTGLQGNLLAIVFDDSWLGDFAWQCDR